MLAVCSSLVIAAVILTTTGFAECLQECPRVDRDACLKDKKAYDLGVCCPSCIPVKDVIQNPVCFPEICTKLTCIPQSLKDCKKGQVFVLKGPCNCCDACKDKPVPPKCKGKNCLWTCVDEEYETCLTQGKAYVPADGDCNCCANCQNVSDVIKLPNSPNENCLNATCTNQTPDKCIRNQVLVPRDDKNFCCDTCRFIKEIDDCSYN